MQRQVDLTLKVVIVSILLTLLLAISNTYLALKVGIVTAASIPAAILSMGIMRFFKSSTIFEHNLVQTAASSGEAIAGGIGYSLPALVIIGFSHGFNYIDSVLLALTGGIMGVLFSAVIRRPLLSDEALRFPEGQAISEVLKLKEKQQLGFKEMLLGGGLAALIEFMQSTAMMASGGIKFLLSKSFGLFGLGIGLSPALIGAGYIVGIRVALSLLLGAGLSYLVILPAISHGVTGVPDQIFANQFAMDMRYIGVGAMLFAALATLLKLIKPLYQNLTKTLSAVHPLHFKTAAEQDLSKKTILFGTFAALLVLMVLFNHLFTLSLLGFNSFANALAILISLIFILAIGFIIAIVCGYFSGLVGVTASPGSAILIGCLILAALLTHGIFILNGFNHTQNANLIGEAVTIIITTVVMQIACIANDTMQDLKVGQIIGASARKQQIMLIFGVVIASLIVPLVMQILYEAYGIAGQMPRAGMDASQSLAAPPAAIMAALTGAVFNGVIPVKMLSIGAGVMLIIIIIQRFILKPYFKFELSYISVGIGMYLSLLNSMPLVIGGVLSYFVKNRLQTESAVQKKILLACGMVAGATLMDVILAVPIALNPQGRALSFSIHPLLSYTLAIGAMLMILSLMLKKSQ